MKSYLLGILVTMIISAVYAISNTEQITVNFLMLNTAVPQGIWEIILFSLGALLMWLFSVGASIETYSSNRKAAKEMKAKIAELEEEKKSLLLTLQSLGGKPAAAIERAERPEEPEGWADSPRTSPEQGREASSNDSALSVVKGFFASLFKSDRAKPEKQPEPEPESKATREIDLGEPGDEPADGGRTGDKETFTV
jgi:uncharacterized integral membrane protein